VTRGARRTLFLVGAATLGGFFVWGFGGLPGFGHFDGRYGLLLDRVAVHERHATDVVSSVVFDYRGFDTLGEEFILFASAIGTALLLRGTRGGDRGLQPETPSAALSLLAAPLGGLLLMLGVYVAAHGYVTPGGGFQGGVVLAAIPVVAFLGGGFAVFRRIAPESALDAVEGIALAGFVSLGIAGVVSGAGYLGNLLPLGSLGTLAAGGTIAVLNDITAVAVGAAFVLFVSEFLEEIAVGG
jgi:multicomponent Na+:H+ antiporter subunit B